MLPKAKAYVKSYDGQTKWMYFLIEDDNLLEKYNTIWDKVSADLKKNLIASLSIKVFWKKKPYGDEVKHFYGKEIPKEVSTDTS